MNYQEFKANFKCPLCKTGFIHPRSSGNLYCGCNNSYVRRDDVFIYFIVSEEGNYAISIQNDEYKLIGGVTPETVIHYGYNQSIFLPTIPDWIFDNNLINRIETLITFR